MAIWTIIKPYSKRWSRTILSICSTLLNVPLKLKGRSRIRLGFGFLLFVFFTIIFSVPLSAGTAAKPLAFLCFLRTLFSAGRCFLLFPWPFSRTGNLLVLLQPAAAPAGLLEPSASAFSFSGVFALLQNRAYGSTAKALDFPKEIRLIFCFILLILFRILPKKPGKNNPRGEMK